MVTTLKNTCEPSSHNKLLKIGELAQQTDVAVGTIRYYETLGLLEPTHRNESRYRYYDFDAIKRVKFIKKAQFLQFSLSEIQQVLGIRDRGNPACPIVRDLLNQKIAHLENQIYQMQTLKAELEVYREKWEDKPLDDPCSLKLCSLIEQVPDKDIPIKK